MASVREIIAAAQEEPGAVVLQRADQWAALVALVEVEGKGDVATVPDYLVRAGRYPLWSPVDLARYTPRILLRIPAVTAEAGRQGVKLAAEAAGDVAETITDPIVAAAQEPIRVLRWLTDPGTAVRIAKVIVGAALVITGLAMVVSRSPAVSQATRAAATVATKGKL